MAEYRKGGKDSEKVDGAVTRLWKYFFRPGSGTTDRLGIAIPMGTVLDERTEDERAEARQDAARSATNIDGEERRRRLVFGPAVLALTGAVAWGLVETKAGPIPRLAVLPLLFLGSGELLSGATGL